MLDPIFGNLNERQAQAVRARQGPLLIVAGAGSGKTRTLTHRIAYLIQQGVPPWQILAVTFTNKAADEMRRRIASLLRITNPKHFEFRISNFAFRGASLPVMGTFHSICARILRRDIPHIGRDRNFVIYDTEDQEKTVKQVLHGMNVPETTLKPRTALAHLSRFKSEAMSPKDAAEQATTEFSSRMVKVYEGYQAMLRDHNALDFDDLLLECVRLFADCPEVLLRYQETWRYLNVDEYQDTNHAQYLILSQLARKERNLCVIGDPDQSIYGFRGADIRNILEFQKDYPDALRVTLEQNYRSTQVILSAADAVIEENPGRPPKKMWTERQGGALLTIHEVQDEKAEAQEVIRTVRKAKDDQGIPFNDHVVLYRTNAQSRLFEEACMRSGTPYRIVGGVKFYARREVKDVLAYLMTIQNPNDAVSLLRILNVPSRKIGNTTVERLQEFCREEKCSLWEALQKCELRTAKCEMIKQFVSLIQKFQRRREEVPVRMLTEELLKDIGMEQWIRDDTTEGEDRWENVQELLSVMQKYDGLDPTTSFVSFLEEVALISEVDSLISARDDALTLMTVHLCKGLEYRTVIIAGCEEGLFPHANALFDRQQLEEERRLMYVGMTRAKDRLHCFFAQHRLLFGELMVNGESRFLLDIPESLVDRRSFSIMSPFVWSTTPESSLRANGAKRSESRSASRLGPMGLARGKQGSSRMRTLHPDGRMESHEEPALEFNQDYRFEEASQESATGVRKGTRILHPTFGQGTVTGKRGDVVEITFDKGSKKTFALSIAPLQIIEGR